MMSLTYRGISYSRPLTVIQAELPSKTLKYRGLAYNISVFTERQSLQKLTYREKLTYRGCSVA
jgi:hypothetical protein